MGLVENFRSGLNKLVSEAFRVGSIEAQFQADTAINAIVIRLQKVMHRRMVEDPPKAKTSLIQRMTLRLSNCRYCFPFRPPSVSCVPCLPLIALVFLFFGRLETYYSLLGSILVCACRV